MISLYDIAFRWRNILKYITAMIIFFFLRGECIPFSATPPPSYATVLSERKHLKKYSFEFILFFLTGSYSILSVTMQKLPNLSTLLYQGSCLNNVWTGKCTNEMEKSHNTPVKIFCFIFNLF